MGHAITFDLIRSPKVEQVVVADKNINSVQSLKEKMADQKIVPIELDVTNHEYVAELMHSADITVSCLPYHFNYDLAKLALQSKSHFCDLGGNHEIAEKIFLLDDVAKEEGVTIIPDLGLAPGLVSILAVCAAESMDELYEIKMRVGGIPQEPENLLLEYGQFFSIEGLINEYVEPCTIIRDGKVYEVPPLSDLEHLEFPKPIGELEAFNTSGGISTLPVTYKDKVKHLDYKTLRYKGHLEKIKLLMDLGLFSNEPVQTSSNKNVIPRELTTELLKEKISKDIADLIVLRVTVTGIVDKKPIQNVWECIDYGDEADGLSAMARMTTFPASIIAQMIARGDISERGVLRQENVVPVKLFLAELASRGINLSMAERAPALKE